MYNYYYIYSNDNDKYDNVDHFIYDYDDEDDDDSDNTNNRNNNNNTSSLEPTSKAQLTRIIKHVHETRTSESRHQNECRPRIYNEWQPRISLLQRVAS